MRATRTSKTTAAAAPDTPEPSADDVPGEVEQAARLRAEAEQLRADAAKAARDADELQQTARAEAQRLITEADQKAGRLRGTVPRLQRQAADLDGLAGCFTEAVTFREQIEATGNRIVELASEADRLREQITGLNERLGELGEQRETCGADLAGARERGDVDRVVELRTRIGAVDEVTGVLQGQRQTAQGRLDAIGDPDDGVGELSRTAGSWQALQAALRRTLNAIDPERPEAVQDKLMADLQFAATANLQRIADQQPKPVRNVVADVTRR